MEKEPFDLIVAHMNYYGTYHHHKDQLIFGGAGLYLAGVTALAIQDKCFWDIYKPEGLIITLLILSGVIGLLFIWWQFRMREFAADMVSACVNLSSKWLVKGPSQKSIEPEEYQGHYWPKELVDELKEISNKRKFYEGPRISELLTYLIMIIWTGIALWRIF